MRYLPGLPCLGGRVPQGKHTSQHWPGGAHVQSYACPPGSAWPPRRPGHSSVCGRVQRRAATCVLRVSSTAVSAADSLLSSRGHFTGHGLGPWPCPGKCPHPERQPTRYRKDPSRLPVAEPGRLPRAELRLSPARTTCGCGVPGSGPGFRVSRGKTFRVASCWWGFLLDPPYLTGTQTHRSGAVTSEGRRSARSVTSRRGLFLGGQHEVTRTEGVWIHREGIIDSRSAHAHPSALRQRGPHRGLGAPWLPHC